MGEGALFNGTEIQTRIIVNAVTSKPRSNRMLDLLDDSKLCTPEKCFVYKSLKYINDRLQGEGVCFRRYKG